MYHLHYQGAYFRLLLCHEGIFCLKFICSSFCLMTLPPSMEETVLGKIHRLYDLFIKENRIESCVTMSTLVFSVLHYFCLKTILLVKQGHF